MNVPRKAALPSMDGMPTQALEHVAGYFQVLSEPTRLEILNLLREGERNVGDLAQACGCTSANISRHLALLMQRGLVARDNRGTSAYYRIADDSVYALCDLVCGAVARRLQRAAMESEAFARTAPHAKATAKAHNARR